jgi:hypothetical protein
MKVDLGEIPVAGYDADDIDFPKRHAALKPETRDLIDVMLESAVSAEALPNAGRFCAITIVGHADRVDVTGVSPEDRRRLELENSTLRAESAQAFVFSEIFKRLTNQGFTGPVDQGSLTNVEIQIVACGSSDLIHKNPGNDMEQRRQSSRAFDRDHVHTSIDPKMMSPITGAKRAQGFQWQEDPREAVAHREGGRKPGKD